MRIGRILERTEVEGPGLRAAVWVQGCSIRCPACCNPELLDHEGGEEIAADMLAARIANLPVTGLTILGGEPLDQAAEIAAMVTGIRQKRDLGIILFTGYSWREVESDHVFRNAVADIDLVIAGPFMTELQPDNRRWIGSRNQTVHPLTARYNTLLERWPPAYRQIEIHLTCNGEVAINGTPFPKNLLDQLFPHIEKLGQ